MAHYVSVPLLDTDSTSAEKSAPNTLAVAAFGEDGGSTGVGGNQADNSVRASGAVYVY
jgi:hypothetical protein